MIKLFLCISGLIVFLNSSQIDFNSQPIASQFNDEVRKNSG